GTGGRVSRRVLSEANPLLIFARLESKHFYIVKILFPRGDASSLLVAAGFKTIVPKTGAQQQKLQALPPDKIAMVQKGGKTYYVFPDAANNRALVGGPKQYQAYQQLRLQNKLAQENLEA